MAPRRRVTIYSRSVFINCPFSHDYQNIFRAILFTVYACGYRPRCAFEVNDSSANRLDKIAAIIRQCRLGIHDISFMQLDHATRLPRFNMPFELGMFLAAKWFGRGQQAQKVALVLDRGRYRYRAALSDMSGQDISSHQGQVSTVIRVVRDWLDSLDRDRQLSGGQHISRAYLRFARQLPHASATQKLSPDELTYADICRAIESWLRDNF